jgi:hypothetical protein
MSPTEYNISKIVPIVAPGPGPHKFIHPELEPHPFSHPEPEPHKNYEALQHLLELTLHGKNCNKKLPSISKDIPVLIYINEISPWFLNQILISLH